MFQRPNAVIFIAIFIFTAIASADRGDELLPQLQSESLKAHVIALQENVQHSPKRQTYRTRSAYHRDAADNAAAYIAAQFRRSSRLLVEFEDFGGMKNVVAKLPPRPHSASDAVFIVCAHYDTKANRDPDWNPLTAIAPGANDNATGVAGVLEIARLLSRFEYDHELRFIAFDGEEVGLMGGRYHARRAAEAGENIAAVFNIDMVGFNWKTDMVEIVTNSASLWLSDALLIAKDWYPIELETKPNRDGAFGNSDHKAFWDKDYHAVTLVESTTPWRDSRGYQANPFYHTSRDTVDKVNFRLVRKVAQLVLVTLNSLASQPSQRTTPTPQLTIQTPSIVNQNPTQISGSFESARPIRIVVDPGGVTAQLDRRNLTFTAGITLREGVNRIRVTALHPLGAHSVEQVIQLERGFKWERTTIFPNPVRSSDDLITFRAEGNMPIDDMQIFIYAADGSLIRQIQGVADSSHTQVWWVWWSGRVAYGIAVPSGIYICRFEAVVNGKTHSQFQKLAIIR
jgi:hypothetical protein